MKPAAFPAQHFSSGTQHTQATPERNLETFCKEERRVGLGCEGGSGSALQRDGVLGARGCLPAPLLLAPCCASLFLPSFTKEPTCVLGEAHRHSYPLDLLLQKAQHFSFALLLQPVTFQGSRLIH